MKKIYIEKRNFMNTVITFKIVCEDGGEEQRAKTSSQRAFGEFDRIVEKYTRFDESSELSKLNAFFKEDSNKKEWFEISEEFYFLISFMVDMSKKTNGAYDPTIIDFLETYGYDKNYDFSKLDDPELKKNIEKISKKKSGWKEIKLKKESSKFLVHFPRNLRIDLGGCGKGYAIDQAFDQIKKKHKNFMIDAGGDVRVFGKNQKGESWRLSLATKNNRLEKYKADSKNDNDRLNDKKIIGDVILENEALASSGSWARKVGKFHHLIDPETGKPVEKDYDTVFVQAKTAMEADAWATAIFIGGRKLAERAPDSLKALFA